MENADNSMRCPWCGTDPLYVAYHDQEWGRPERDPRRLFELLMLEAFQAGLSWITVLRKRPAFRAAFHDFDADTVAAYGPDDVARLMADAGIVRNRRKVEAAITNARATVALRDRGGLEAFIWGFAPEPGPAPRVAAEVPTTSPESVALSTALKQAGFAHVGPTTMYALMEAIGVVDTHLMDSHRRGSSGVWTAEGAG